MIQAQKFAILLSLLASLTGVYAKMASAKSLSYTVLKTSPHDSHSFTQGLAYSKGVLFESSGLYQKSFVRIYNESTGHTLRETRLPPQIFAEGLTLYNKKLYLLSWQAGQLFVLDSESLAVTDTFAYSGQGWGIAHDGTHFYTSDGSDTLQIRSPKTFKPIRQLTVSFKNNKSTIDRINELEYARKTLWANRWLTNTIYAIDPETGDVTGELDLTKLVPFSVRKSRDKVLNGIAYAPDSDAFWVTGKHWPVRYLLRIE